MEAIRLDGKKLASEIELQLLKRVNVLKQKYNYTPVLAAIIVGEDPASKTYVKMKSKACARVGLNSVTVNLSKNTTTEKLVNKIRELNADSKICGILLQHPTPLHIDEQLCFNEIALNKDVDGVSATSFGNMTNGYPAFKCATPLGIITLLKHYNIIIEGKHAVIVGRSAILGKPTAMLLLQENATVTICHRKTINLEQYVRQADILVAAVGKANLIKSAWLKPNVILIDCGYNQNNVGDIELDNHALSICSAYTPVPGGVGPMTISSLISQAVEAAEIYSAFLPEKRN